MGNAITCEPQAGEKPQDGTSLNRSNSKVRKQRHSDLYRKDLQQKKLPLFLEEPVMSKLTERGETNLSIGVANETADEDERESRVDGNNNKLRYAVSEMQGWRSHMEDKHLLNPALFTCRQQERLVEDHHLFAVFDGHGGGFASHFCAENFVSTLVARNEWKTYLKLSSKGPTKSSSKRESVIGLSLLKSALTATFLELDTKLVEVQRQRRISQLSHLEDLAHSLAGNAEYDVFKPGTEDRKSILNFSRKLPASMPAEIPFERSGCTGVVVLITPSHILCANAGDSRAILAKKTEFSSNGEVLPLSFDHKPNKDVELCRVENDGGFVKTKRVDGNLAVSRGFGDFEYKNCNTSDGNGKTGASYLPKDHRVTVNPDIIVHTREPSSDEFVVLGCDGIWDRLSNRLCAYIIRDLVYNDGETDTGLICEEVIDTALEMDSWDNMTCCVVFFPAANNGALNIDRGVLKRRADRKKAWGDGSTPAKRSQLRMDKRRKNYRQRSRSTPTARSSSDKGKKHKAPDSPPRALRKNRRPRSGKNVLR